MRTERAGDLLALTCALVCGLGNVPIKLSLEGLEPDVFSFYFFFFGLLISSLLFLRGSARRQILATEARVFTLMGILCVLFGLAIYTFISALTVADPATVAFLSRFEIILTLLLAFAVLRERLGVLEILGGIIAVSGVLLLKYRTSAEVSKAATLMIISAFCFAIGEIVVKRFVQVIGTLRFIFWRNLVLSALFALVVIWRGHDFQPSSPNALGHAFLAALLLPIVGRAAFIEALKRSPISRVSLITQSVPLFAALFAYLLLDTLPTRMEWVGGGLILAGVIVVQRGRHQPVRTSVPPAE